MGNSEKVRRVEGKQLEEGRQGEGVREIEAGKKCSWRWRGGSEKATRREEGTVGVRDWVVR